MTAVLEHANFTVADPNRTARWMQDVFGWHIRWQGEALDEGFTVHVGTEHSYVALYRPATGAQDPVPRYVNAGALNHIAIVVDDLEGTEAKVRAAGFIPGEHHDYEPGQRFYFHDENDVEYEVVSYA